jgi:hypothetical protein
MSIKKQTSPAQQNRWFTPSTKVRLWQSGMTRSPFGNGIRAPWSHLRSDGTGGHSPTSRQSILFNKSSAAGIRSHPVAEAESIIFLPPSPAFVRGYIFSFIPYTSCTTYRHWPKGLSVANATLIAPALLHLSRRYAHMAR